MASAFSVQHRIFYGLAPRIEQGPRMLVKSYVAAGAGDIGDNLTKEMLESEIEFIQGMYFNNKAGGGIVTLNFYQSEVSIEIANKTQGFLPLFVGQEPHFIMTFAAAGTLRLNFVNVPVAPYIWATT